MADQLPDNSGMITGECKDYANECIEGYWCLDDGCPPGCVPYEPPPEFPIVPSTPVNCVLSNRDHDCRYERSVLYPNFWVKHDFNLTSYVVTLLDNNFNVVATNTLSFASPGLEVLIGNHIYFYDFKSFSGLWNFYSMNIDTSVVAVIKSQNTPRVEGPLNVAFVNAMTTDGGRICISSIYYVSGVQSGGAYITNILGEYVDHIPAPDYSVVVLIQNRYLVATEVGTTIAMYDINKVSLGNLSTPDADASIGKKMIDLGDDGGIGRIAVSHNDKVYLYDYTFTLIAVITSPFAATGTFGSFTVSTVNNWDYHSARYHTFSIARYGNFIVIGDASQNIGGTQSGGMYYYDLDGNFVSIASSPNWGIIPFNADIGGAIAISDTVLRGWGTDVNATSANKVFTCEM